MAGHVAGPEARKTVAELQRWHCFDFGLILGLDDEGMCFPAVLVYAVDVWRGPSFVTCYMGALRKLGPSVRSLSEIAGLEKQTVGLVPLTR